MMKKKHGMLKGKTEEKEKTRENDKPRVFLKKGLWGEQTSKASLKITGNPFSVSEIITPLFENRQKCRENGVSCHNHKAKQQTQGPKCKEVGFGRGM